MNVPINRLFHGKASIRDYQMKQALVNNEDIVIILGNKSMRILNKDISKGIVNADIFKSIHEKGLEYRLVDYPWHPDTQQQTLL